MVFSSVVFLLYFLPITIFIYFVTPEKWKNHILLLLSICFYAWGNIQYVILLLLLIAVNVIIGIGIDRAKSRKGRRYVFLTGLFVDVGSLFFFKYIDFFITIVKGILLRTDFVYSLKTMGIALPLGISFFIFQEISYIADVYRGIVPAQKNFLKLGLYICMFPQLIAGPIVRYTDVLSEIENRKSSVEDIYMGVRRFILGLSEKVIIADILAGVTQKIFKNAGIGGYRPKWPGLEQ